MTAKKKLAQKRLTLLQLAEKPRNVSEACHHHDVFRNQFYEYERGFPGKGLLGLMNHAPILKTFPNETPSEVKKRLSNFSLIIPPWSPCTCQ